VTASALEKMEGYHHPDPVGHQETMYAFSMVMNF
jgi:hypothetical protein